MDQLNPEQLQQMMGEFFCPSPCMLICRLSICCVFGIDHTTSFGRAGPRTRVASFRDEFTFPPLF